ncbi:MAG: hypothetical protein ACR2QL_03845 [Woeseiaceae bacterium]
MTRARLFSLRFAASASVLALAFLLVRLLWFPSGYFQIFGVGKLFLMMAGAALIVGPALSTLFFKPGKKGMKFDLIALAAVELMAVGWGMTEIAARRPVYAVFAVDRFEAVAAAEIDMTQIRYAEHVDLPGTGPRLVYAELPTDGEVMNRLIDETVLYGMADIDRRPEFWKPYPQGVVALKTAAAPLTDLLRAGDSRAAVIDKWLRGQKMTASELLFLPIRGRKGDGTIILHADIGYPVAVLPVDPW